jgi:hypothetical protein
MTYDTFTLFKPIPIPYSQHLKFKGQWIVVKPSPEPSTILWQVGTMPYVLLHTHTYIHTHSHAHTYPYLPILTHTPPNPHTHPHIQNLAYGSWSCFRYVTNTYTLFKPNIYILKHLLNPPTEPGLRQLVLL